MAFGFWRVFCRVLPRTGPRIYKRALRGVRPLSVKHNCHGSFAEIQGTFADTQGPLWICRALLRIGFTHVLREMCGQFLRNTMIGTEIQGSFVDIYGSLMEMQGSFAHI